MKNQALVMVNAIPVRHEQYESEMEDNKGRMVVFRFETVTHPMAKVEMISLRLIMLIMNGFLIWTSWNILLFL